MNDESSYSYTVRHVSRCTCFGDKAWHGKGVATSLLTAALDVAKQGQAEHIWLTVWPFNPRAIAYYKKMGFTQVGETHFQFAQERQTGFVMMKAL